MVAKLYVSMKKNKICFSLLFGGSVTHPSVCDALSQISYADSSISVTHPSLCDTLSQISYDDLSISVTHPSLCDALLQISYDDLAISVTHPPLYGMHINTCRPYTVMIVNVERSVANKY